jgi:transcriptional regulator with XRE-family HTH domain
MRSSLIKEKTGNNSKVLSRRALGPKEDSKAELIFKEIGSYLREHREKAGLSQMEVSRALGYTTSQFLSNCERGVSSLPLEKLPALVKLYGMSRRQLIEFILKAQRTYLERELAEPASKTARPSKSLRSLNRRIH